MAASGRSALTIALSAIGIILIAALTVWASVAGYHALQANNRLHSAISAYQQGIAAQKAGDTTQAIDDYNQALRQAPRGSNVADLARKALVQSYTAQGSQAIDTGNAAAAQQAYQNALTTDSQNADAHYGLARTYEQQNDMTDAFREYAAAAKADPFGTTGIDARQKAANGYYQLGDQAAQAGNLNDARNYWQQVIAVDPTSAIADQARQRIQQAGAVNSPDNTSSGVSPTGPYGTTGPNGSAPLAGTTASGTPPTTIGPATTAPAATNGASSAPSGQATTRP